MSNPYGCFDLWVFLRHIRKSTSTKLFELLFMLGYIDIYSMIVSVATHGPHYKPYCMTHPDTLHTFVSLG